ncbi:hypothetical protein B296_00041887 [Ensete ventricosum]|uniref:Uncharacterized protein n=1 Tax=Ensete ventricosum TaxID=4639 RepID=A0A426YJH7_ENSVE|nr:hypothetical protein B296_00041887 [Ensete ventricosum]
MTITSAVPVFGSRPQRVGSFEESLLSDLEKDLCPSGVERNIARPGNGTSSPGLIDVECSCVIDDPPYSAKCCGCSIASKESTQRDSGHEYKRGHTQVVRGQRVRMLSSSYHFVAGPNVVGAPPRPGNTHNEVQATSIRGAPRRQFKVGVCGCSAQVVTLMRVLLTSPKCSYKTIPSLGWWVPGEVPLTIKLGLFRRVKSGVSCSEAGASSLLIEVERER